MTAPFVPVGFDYAQALLKIRHLKTYAEIAERIGYDSRNAVYKIIGGAIPPHPQGEAIYVLYIELFGEKPPMSQSQAQGSFVTQRDTAHLSSAA